MSPLLNPSSRRAGGFEPVPQLCVEVLDPLQHALYDQAVSACSNSVLFHSRAWLQVIHETYGHRPLCVVVKHGGEVLAMLPIVELQSWITGKRGVMLPFADFCPPMAQDAAVYEVARAEAVKYGQQRGWKYLEIRGGREFMPEARASITYYAHVLDLSRGPEELFGRFDTRMRTAVRKAEREGVRAEVANTPEAMRIFYALHCETRKKHGVPPQPFSFFQSIVNHLVLKNAGVIVVARYQQTPIAASVFLHQGRQAVYKFSASNDAFRALPGNNLVMWEAIQWYARQGVSSMHFGRTSLGNAGLRKYKAGWGTEESTLEYFKYSLSEQAYVADKDRADGSLNQFLRLLPTPLFCLVGRILYRHLA